MISTTRTTEPSDKADIVHLFENFSIELTASTVLKRNDLSDLFQKNQLIYITFLPNAEFSHTLAACEKLIHLGYQVRPHIAARSLHSHDELDKGLARIRQLGIRSVLLIAGAVNYPKGPFDSTLEILSHYHLADYGIEEISFAGHPEGNTDIVRMDLGEIEHLKQQYVLEHHLKGSFTSQFGFKATPIIDWLEHLQQARITLPVSVGIPGLVSTKSLINHARACGVGASMNYLWRYSRSIKQLLTLNSPDVLIFDLAKYHAQCKHQSLLKNLHFFPFGGLEATLQWINQIQTGKFDINHKGIRIHEK